MKTSANTHRVAGVLFMVCAVLYVSAWWISGKPIWLSLACLHVTLAAVFFATGKSAASRSTPTAPPDDDRPR